MKLTRLTAALIAGATVIAPLSFKKQNKNASVYCRKTIYGGI